MNRALRPGSTAPHVVVLAVVAGVAGCALSDTGEGIGLPCAIGEVPCSLDHVCRPVDDDGVSDDVAVGDAGLCTPIADLGSCGQATYAQRSGGTRDEALIIDEAEKLIRVETEEIARINGDFIIGAPSAGQVLVVDDLCDAVSLQSVQGRLAVRRSSVTSLDGLQGVGHVGGGVLIAQNPQLVNLDGLFNLMSVLPADDLPASVVIASNVRLPGAALRAFKERMFAQSPSVSVFSCNNAAAAAVDDSAECPDLPDA